MKKLLVALAALVGAGVLAIWLLGDRDIPPDVLLERYANAQSRFLELPGGTVAHVRDQGNPSGEALVLVHGSNASLHTWEPWVAILGDEFRVVTLDLPGHGLTGRTIEDEYGIEAMSEFIDVVTRELGLTRFHLAGSSMGGRASWLYALDHPERLDRLILVAASGFPEPDGEEAALGYRLAKMPLVAPLLLYVTPRSVIAQSVRATFSDESVATEDMITRYHELILREGTRRATQKRLRLPTENGRVGELSRVENPTLVLWGEDDAFVPVEHAHRFGETFPNATVRIYENVGHIPMEEIPARSAADVRAFLNGAP